MIPPNKQAILHMKYRQELFRERYNIQAFLGHLSLSPLSACFKQFLIWGVTVSIFHFYLSTFKRKKCCFVTVCKTFCLKIFSSWQCLTHIQLADVKVAVSLTLTCHLAKQIVPWRWGACSLRHSIWYRTTNPTLRHTCVHTTNVWGQEVCRETSLVQQMQHEDMQNQKTPTL